MSVSAVHQPRLVAASPDDPPAAPIPAELADHCAWRYGATSAVIPNCLRRYQAVELAASVGNRLRSSDAETGRFQPESRLDPVALFEGLS